MSAGAQVAVAVGSAVAGAISSRKAARRQAALEGLALDTNLKQARLKAAESAEINAQSFRKALASQVAIGAQRGASGTLLATYGQEAYRNFLKDQRAIELGLDLSEIQGAISREEISANKRAKELAAYTRFAQLGTRGINLNQLFGEK
jgi:hypothetical protein